MSIPYDAPIVNTYSTRLENLFLDKRPSLFRTNTLQRYSPQTFFFDKIDKKIDEIDFFSFGTLHSAKQQQVSERRRDLCPNKLKSRARDKQDKLGKYLWYSCEAKDFSH